MIFNYGWKFLYSWASLCLKERKKTNKNKNKKKKEGTRPLFISSISSFLNSVSSINSFMLSNVSCTEPLSGMIVDRKGMRAVSV